MSPSTSIRFRTAAHDVYQISELRQRILSLLDLHDLASFLLVDRKLMADVVRELYREVDFDQFWDLVDLTTQRKQLYCDAIKNVRIYDSSFPAEITRALRLNPRSGIPNYEIEVRSWLSGYQPTLLDILIPLLSTHCPNVRKVYFGERYERHWVDAQWIVNFDPPVESISPFRYVPTIQNRTGVIHLFHRVRCNAREIPPVEKVYLPDIAPIGFALQTFFDLDICSGGPPHSAWLEHLRSRSHFANLYKTAGLGSVPVTLGDISSLYQRQIVAGHEHRIETIYATAVQSFHLADFQSFAGIASTSLRRLILSSTFQDTMLSFTDLSSLTDIIISQLPNLAHLHLALNDVEIAEPICERMLDANILSCRGSIEELLIHTSADIPNLFSALRVLSILLAEDGPRMGVGTPATSGSSREATQIQYVQFLRKQSPRRRRYLSTVNFPALGIHTLEEVLRLAFDEDDQPLHADEARARRWSDTARSAESLSRTLIIPDLSAALNRFVESSDHVVLQANHARRDARFMSLSNHRREINKLVEVGKEIEAMLQKARQVGAEVDAALAELEA